MPESWLARRAPVDKVIDIAAYVSMDSTPFVAAMILKLEAAGKPYRDLALGRPA